MLIKQAVFLTGKIRLKELSEALGKEMIETFNTSDTRGNSPSYGTNYLKLGKELMSRDEIAVLDGRKCVLQLRGVRPFLSDKYDLTKHPNYKYTADFDKRFTFDIEKFLNHRVKLKADDEYEVIEAEGYLYEGDLKRPWKNVCRRRRIYKEHRQLWRERDSRIRLTSDRALLLISTARHSLQK